MQSYQKLQVCAQLRQLFYECIPRIVFFPQYAKNCILCQQCNFLYASCSVRIILSFCFRHIFLIILIYAHCSMHPYICLFIYVFNSRQLRRCILLYASSHIHLSKYLYAYCFLHFILYIQSNASHFLKSYTLHIFLYIQFSSFHCIIMHFSIGLKCISSYAYHHMHLTICISF